MSNEELKDETLPEYMQESGGHEETKLPVKEQLALLAAILLIIFGTTIAPKILAFLQTYDATASLTEYEEAVSEVKQEQSSTEQKTPFEDVNITGKSAYVWDVNNQKALFKKEETLQLPLASVAKLMTALVAEEILDENEQVAIDAQSVRQSGDSGLAEGEVFSRLSLSDLVLMSSSNDGAFALASAAGNILLPGTDGARSFVDAMNIRAQELGLHDTYFKNPTGLDISKDEAGAYGTSRDMAFLMEYIIKNEPDILVYTKEHEARVYSESGNFHDAENTNYYIDEIPGLIGSKTGFTDLAGGNLVVAFDAGLNRPIIVAVLGSTQQDRFSDVLTLVKEAQSYAANQDQ